MNYTISRCFWNFFETEREKSQHKVDGLKQNQAQTIIPFYAQDTEKSSA